MGVKPISFPIEQNHKLGKVKGQILSHSDSYRRLVVRLVYLTNTHPNFVLLYASFISVYTSTNIGPGLLGCSPPIYEGYP